MIILGVREKSADDNDENIGGREVNDDNDDNNKEDN